MSLLQVSAVSIKGWPLAVQPWREFTCEITRLRFAAPPVLFTGASYGQSLGDVAREQRQKQQAKDPKAAPKVVTNEEIPESPETSANSSDDTDGTPDSPSLPQAPERRLRNNGRLRSR